jgi:hypothetical protein
MISPISTKAGKLWESPEMELTERALVNWIKEGSVRVAHLKKIDQGFPGWFHQRWNRIALFNSLCGRVASRCIRRLSRSNQASILRVSSIVGIFPWVSQDSTSCGSRSRFLARSDGENHPVLTKRLRKTTSSSGVFMTEQRNTDVCRQQGRFFQSAIPKRTSGFVPRQDLNAQRQGFTRTPQEIAIFSRWDSLTKAE